MSNISQTPLAGDSWSTRALIPWLMSPMALTIFLAAATAVVFFSEHDVSISDSLTFVADIENQEVGLREATDFVKSCF